jgi:hypothetical protein
VLARDVESDLRPVVTFLLTLGIEVRVHNRGSQGSCPLTRDARSPLCISRHGLYTLNSCDSAPGCGCCQAAEVTRIMSAWPELLLARVDTQLAPWACYLEEELGASGTQVAEIIRLCPHL